MTEAGESDHDGLRLPHPEIDLVRIAESLRGVMPRLDEEARERLEAAWVSLLNAVKQPKADAARLARRFGRLRDELDAMVSRSADQSEDDQVPTDRDTPKPVHSQSAQHQRSGE